MSPRAVAASLTLESYTDLPDLIDLPDPIDLLDLRQCPVRIAPDTAAAVFRT